MKQLKKELSLQDRAFSDLVALGWKSTEAFKIVFSTKAENSSIPTLASRKTASTEISLYINSKKLLLSNVNVDSSNSQNGAENSTGKVRDKADIRLDLNSLIDKEKDPSKKSKMLVELASLDQMKKSETLNTEGQQTRYYLPLRCESCSLFRNSRVSGELDRCKSCDILKYVNTLPEAEKADFLNKTKLFTNTTNN